MEPLTQRQEGKSRTKIRKVGWKCENFKAARKMPGSGKIRVRGRGPLGPRVWLSLGQREKEVKEEGRGLAEALLRRGASSEGSGGLGEFWGH